MTKILANNPRKKQMIFNTYVEAAKYFNTTLLKLKKCVDTGDFLKTDKGIWFFDILEEESEQIKK